jgi:HTH-type transcriptional regulator, glycine betaine synthesis regulator
MTRPLSVAEVRVSDVVGRLMEFWGFRRNMGRIWALLYLSPEPLSAEALRSLLGLSTGAVSMTLSELLRWGVVRKVWVQGERKDYFTAEVQLWKMISRVFNERERAEIVSAIEAFEDALRALEPALASVDHEERARAEMQRERISQLLEFARVGKSMLDALMTTAKLDIQPLARLFTRAASGFGLTRGRSPPASP